ncbi:unnamed protein product [Chrysodeixis includens]|uniref:DUF7869 domain-containing protein n=1 Tax=Chrysodeixis includens TaxID=689277 RepID=A0A9P0FUU7_CHRIL|nr:unnamed protein product [Chrysodeixis includens]
MGSRSKKILSMVPIPDNNLKKNNTFVENWLANCHPEDQDNDHDFKLESSRFSVNNITSTSCEAKNELLATDRSTVCDNAVDTVIQEVNADLILLNTVTENVTSKDIENAVITTDSKTFNLSDDEEIVSSNVVIADVVPETTLAKSMLRPDTVSNEMNSDNNEDFSASDGSEYEPPQKKAQKKVFQPIRRTSSSSSDSSTSSSGSSSSSTGSSSSSSSSSGSRSKHSKSTSRSKHPSNVSIVHHNAASENIQPSIEQASIVTKSKKRTRNPSQWQKNQRKQLKNSGQAYTSSRGKSMPEKSIRPPCTSTCRLSCSNKFTTEDRDVIFKTYWGLNSFQRQRDFLASCVKQVEPEFRTIKIRKGGDVNRKCRKPNTSYFLVNRGSEIKVCKTFLLNTLAISNKPLRTVTENKFASTSVIPTDKRGKHGKQSKLDAETIQSVRDHINSIPRMESHYIRANSSREYIDGGLTVAELHRNYSQKRIADNKAPANYDAYHRIFNTEFNISFFIPRKDQCDVCEAFKNAVDKEPLMSSYKLHQEEKSLSRIEKKQDIDECKKPDSNSIVAIFDLQAVLPCPIGQSSAFFYKSKLNCYNFTVSDIKINKTFCFFWHEGLGKRGANEIGSCLYNFLKECSSTKPNSDITFFSDNCCGQQKNKFILSLYYYAVSTLPIKSITHKFLIRGHTQNEADSVHSVIEKNIRRAKKSGPIYTPDQYVALIRNAKKTGNSFTVNEMSFDSFYDLKLLSNDINLNTGKNIDGETIRISDVKVVKFIKDSDTYLYKTTYKSERWKEAKIKISRAGKKNISDIQLCAAYSSKLPIANNKKQDIQQLITANIVPKYYENTFNSLFE